MSEKTLTLQGLEGRKDIAALRADVNAFAASFPMPGFDVASMKYKSKRHPY